MRFLKTYLRTMIIIFLLAVFIYTMSFVYKKSVQTTVGTDVSVLSLTENENSATFFILGKEFSVDKNKINSAFSGILKKLPCEFSAAADIFNALGDKIEKIYYEYY